MIHAIKPIRLSVETSIFWYFTLSIERVKKTKIRAWNNGPPPPEKKNQHVPAEVHIFSILKTNAIGSI